MDSGEYRCEAHGEWKEEVAVIYLHVAGLKLVSRSHGFDELIPGDDVTLYCHLSPKKSAVAMEIRWFKGTDCICLYQNGQVKEGKGYEGRLGLCTHELRKGDVSLILRNLQVLDGGRYKCKVSHRGDEVENNENFLRVSELKLTAQPNYYFRFSMTETPIFQTYTIYACVGDDVILSCHLSPKMNAVAMEIRWFKGTECICLYQNRKVKEGKDYEGRVSLFTQELEEGNVSLMLREVQQSDGGEYKCEVTRRKYKLENSGVNLHISEFKLVHRSEDVGKSSVSVYGAIMVNVASGCDAILPCYLSPKKSAVAMEIRWFKGRDCICLYQNGQVKEGKGYEGKVRLFTHELRKGDVSLILMNFCESRDEGLYKCEVTCGDEKLETSVHVSYKSLGCKDYKFLLSPVTLYTLSRCGE
ncbi:hypothetical protein AMELA_G00073900 [Ameiurus melas]|uniref:Ig-like domain-containing protein n=1 Tax=Ameiurus melas TaxID=219545 RepID=A0A7J6B042_AMEME|nr:hypothetical protein AMELA_G00073900 [Ameiurus melas]